MCSIIPKNIKETNWTCIKEKKGNSQDGKGGIPVDFKQKVIQNEQGKCQPFLPVKWEIIEVKVYPI